jgi:hypothetical protein
LYSDSLVPPLSGPGAISSSSLASIISSELALRASIERLLRERETLRQDTDVKTLALVLLLEEQQRVRRRDSPAVNQDMRTATLDSAHIIAASLLDRRASRCSAAVHHSYLASLSNVQQHPLQQHLQQYHCFSFPHRSLY